MWSGKYVYVWASIDEIAIQAIFLEEEHLMTYCKIQTATVQPQMCLVYSLYAGNIGCTSIVCYVRQTSRNRSSAQKL